jgi:DNA-binding response OmpR family regulator
MSRILLVEDDYLSNLALSRDLRDAGFEVEAPFGLVTDLDLGPGPDGFEVARYARWRRPLVQVIYMSSEPPRLPSVFCLGSTFVPKPYEAKQIIDALWRPEALTAAAA